MSLLDLSRHRPFALRLHAIISAVHEFSGLLVSRLVSEEDVQLQLYVHPAEPLTILHPDGGTFMLDGGQTLSYDWRLGLSREDIAPMEAGRAERFGAFTAPPLTLPVCPTCRRPWLGAPTPQGGDHAGRPERGQEG